MNIDHEKAMDCCHLRADCASCFGLCCAALYYSASEGFPSDKEAGEPCVNLQTDFLCSVHPALKERGLNGCMAFDCLGAGQKVCQITFDGNDWRKVPESAEKMFEAFLIMRQLHEMLWYLAEALTYEQAHPIYAELQKMLDEIDNLSRMSAEELFKLNTDEYRHRVNDLLSKTSEKVRADFQQELKKQAKRRKILGRGADFIGADLRKADLHGADLRGAYLIAADLSGNDLSGTDFIGADLRDADIRGADLSASIFLTQAQINAAKGDENTKLPPSINRPSHWD